MEPVSGPGPDPRGCWVHESRDTNTARHGFFACFGRQVEKQAVLGRTRRYTVCQMVGGNSRRHPRGGRARRSRHAGGIAVGTLIGARNPADDIQVDDRDRHCCSGRDRRVATPHRLTGCPAEPHPPAGRSRNTKHGLFVLRPLNPSCHASQEPRPYRLRRFWAFRFYTGRHETRNTRHESRGLIGHGLSHPPRPPGFVFMTYTNHETRDTAFFLSTCHTRRFLERFFTRP